MSPSGVSAIDWSGAKRGASHNPQHSQSRVGDERFLQLFAQLAAIEVFPYIEPMEVHFTPDVEKKLNDLAAQSGRGTDELLQDALAAYFDELAQTRDMLNSRYDELKSGRVKPLDGEEALARLKAKTEAQRNRPA
jgi:predicted transcriptional regulator